eukprot:5257533-Prymnesium_polylepis.1
MWSITIGGIGCTYAFSVSSSALACSVMCNSSSPGRKRTDESRANARRRLLANARPSEAASSGRGAGEPSTSSRYAVASLVQRAESLCTIVRLPVVVSVAYTP